MIIPTCYKEYQRLLDRQMLLDLAQMCGARYTSPIDLDKARREHIATCAACKILEALRQQKEVGDA